MTSEDTENAIEDAIERGDADLVASLIGDDKSRLEMTTVFGT